jgi:ubiquinone/menaquinone biosynthesis C-methylase UbiE
MLHHVVDWERALAEAARVLRPEGLLVGADLLATLPARLLHRLEGARYRMVTRRELHGTLQALPFGDVAVTPDPTRLAVRFSARKADARDAAAAGAA